MALTVHDIFRDAADREKRRLHQRIYLLRDALVSGERMRFYDLAIRSHRKSEAEREAVAQLERIAREYPDLKRAVLAAMDAHAEASEQRAAQAAAADAARKAGEQGAAAHMPKPQDAAPKSDDEEE
jgi:hypothetical protein